MSEHHQLDIEQLRRDVASGQRSLRITTHAQVEAFKDGLALVDLRYTFEHGDLIEEYPDESRGLLYVDVPDIDMPDIDMPDIDMPVHIVVEDTPGEGIIITAYIPDKRLWIKNRIRKPKR